MEKRPRERIVACIERYTSIVIDVDESTIDGLRDRPTAAAWPSGRDVRLTFA